MRKVLIAHGVNKRLTESVWVSTYETALLTVYRLVLYCGSTRNSSNKNAPFMTLHSQIAASQAIKNLKY